MASTSKWSGTSGLGRSSCAGPFGAPPFSAFAIRDGGVVGAVAVDDSKAVRAARRLIDRAIPVNPEAVADPSTDLRRLVRG